MEILNLARFLSIMKLRPLVWRNSHPYMVADRMEDLTPSSVVQQDRTVDRTVSLFGYLHGTNFKSWMKVHVAGVGDFSVREIRKLHDLQKQQGYALIPLSVYFKDSRVKVELGLCKGKKTYDKREAVAKRDAKREMERAMREKNR